MVAACGNGTAGAFSPRVLEAIGCEVVPLDCDLDHSFPRYNPNPEDMAMLHAIRDAVLANHADVGLGFDGDGDRCGVVDDKGDEIFADKVGVMLARDMSALHPGATFVVDVKSTGLFVTDPVLQKNGVKADYWKTGHSYMKRRTHEIGALAGSRSPAISSSTSRSAAAMTTASCRRSRSATCSTAIRARSSRNSRMRCRKPGSRRPCRRTAPTRPNTAWSIRSYSISRWRRPRARWWRVNRSASVVTVNGVRVTVEDGTWGLVRASSNKPELVVVVESPVSDARMRDMFKAVDGVLRRHKEVGAYNQTI